MYSQNKRLTSETPSNKLKPLSAWERRKLYSKQMYDQQRTNRNSENKTSRLKVNSENQTTVTKINSKMTKRKLSLARNEKILKEENQIIKKHKATRDKVSLYPKKKTSPKQKLQSNSGGKENSETKKSNSFSTYKNFRQHSVDTCIEKDSMVEHPSMPKICRSASFTIDKRNDKPSSLAEGNIILETQNTSYKIVAEVKTIANVSKDTIVETNLCQENKDDSVPNVCSRNENTGQYRKTPLKKLPLKSDRKVSLGKKDKLVKPTYFLERTLNRREQLLKWKEQQDNNPTFASKRRMTCGPAILGSSKQLGVKQTISNVNQMRDQRTRTTAEFLRKERIKRTSNSSLFTAIVSKSQEQKNSRLSTSQKRNGSFLTEPKNDKCSSQHSKKLHSTSILLPKWSVAAKIEKSVTKQKAAIERYCSRNSMLKNKPNKSDTKLQNKKKSGLSISQKGNGSSLTIPINDKHSFQRNRKSLSKNILPTWTVTAKGERFAANQKTPIDTHGTKKNMLKSESIKKNPNKSDAKNKSICLNQLLDSKTKNEVTAEQYNNGNIVFESGKNEIKMQLKHDSQRNNILQEQAENNFTIEMKDASIEQSQNDTVTNYITPSDNNIVSSCKKSVCFDVPLLGTTPGKPLPKTPKRDFTLRERLQLWLDNKGHSISNFRHVKCFGYHLSNMKLKKNFLSESHDENDITPVPEIDEPTLGESPLLRTRSSSERSLRPSADDDFDVNEVLIELKALLSSGHPTKDITEWLDELVKYLPAVEENPQYWICRSLVAELQSGVNGAIAVYHAALDKKVHCSHEEKEHKAYTTSNKYQVVTMWFLLLTLMFFGTFTTMMNLDRLNGKQQHTAEICKGLDGLLRRYTENFNKNVDQLQTPRRQAKLNEYVQTDTPREPLIDKKNIFNSTVIKFGVSYNTPGSYKSSVKAVVTPVRRSSRLSCTSKPKNTTSDTLLESLTDLPQNIKDDVLFRENDALVLD